MRFVAYVGASVVLATGIVIRALDQRANFYSASVYLAQSNACLMILTNLILLGTYGVMLGLQKLLYGPLRPIEIEQLYEKAWFAITETCLAMTIFREEVGGWFLVMFVSLLIGKIWGWIGEGRVDVLEQQPPANPRLFHTRLSISLLLSTLFEIYMLRYSVQTVLRQARPNMMVMFAFEFAVLAVTSISTTARYTMSLHESAVIKKQIRVRLEERRAQVRREREEAQERSTQNGENTSVELPDLAQDPQLDDVDVDVPGWEDKGRWLFYLDLGTDFCKLVLYLSFFFVLCMFYGMPIHIIRDVLMTIRSFYKRITDFMRYRHATKDMNDRYPDATAEEVSSADICIICRETMRPWNPPNNPTQNEARPHTGGLARVDERSRPKRLPCGHILHFGCLRSWLERQQNCPTCRRSVLVSSTVPSPLAPQNGGLQARAQLQFNAGGGNMPFQAEAQQPGIERNRIRVFNFGPFRLGFGAGQGLAQQFNNRQLDPQQGHNAAIDNAQPVGVSLGFGRQPIQNTITRFGPSAVQAQLQSIERQIMHEINSLRAQADQLHMVRALQGELARLRIIQANPSAHPHNVALDVFQQNAHAPLGGSALHSPTIRAFGTSQQVRPLQSGHQELPPGLTIPEGWTLLPLQRVPNGAVPGNIGSISQVIQAGSPANNNLDGNANRSTTYSNVPQFPNNSPEGQDKATPVGPVENSTLTNTHGLMDVSFQGSDTQIASERTQPIVPRAQLAHDTRNSLSHTQGVDSFEASSPSLDSSAVVPQWAASSAELNSHHTYQDNRSPAASTTSEEAVQSESSPTMSDERRKAKGKGRAVTIEDTSEDVD